METCAKRLHCHVEHAGRRCRSVEHKRQRQRDKRFRAADGGGKKAGELIAVLITVSMDPGGSSFVEEVMASQGEVTLLVLTSEA